jgi:predicted DNA-binding transcriptional regulator AlpA
MQQTFIRMAQLASTPTRTGRLPLHPNTLWRKVKSGEFPAPVKLGPNSTAWKLSDVEAWEVEQAYKRC